MSGDGELRDPGASSTKGGAAGVRSASPAKRSRADMEGEEKTAQDVPGSFAKEQTNTTTTDFDEAMTGMTPAQSGDADTQITADGSVQTSAQESMTTNTSATSLQSEELPTYSDATSAEKKTPSIPSIDEQEQMLKELQLETLDEGQIGFVVSKKWLDRLFSRSSRGVQESYPKEAREGDIGPIDNSDIVPEGTFSAHPIVDANKKEYIPIKPGLTSGEDYELLPERAYGQLLGWYGQVLGQKAIARYAHNTAPADATAANIMYDMYPPVFTVRKVPQSEGQRPSSVKSSYEALRKRTEGKMYGQITPDDAIRIVSSRSEKFQNFLRRAKEIADIPFSTKVKIWRVGRASNAVAKGNPSGVLSPPHSRSTSPSVEQERPKLVIDAATFNKMEECELVDGKDETGNSNYNGSSTMDMYQLFEDADLVLEEQIGGPADGKYASDNKPKDTIRLGLPGRSTGSKAPSAAPSRGTSPAPGMMTRGRQRKDGRTRGTVGLSNLGNTCYMNSALQCIRSVEELATYFLSGQYKKEINTGNPLGHAGVMAKQYALLLGNIYGENAGGSFTPSNFKKTLGSLQPMFSGYGQQDSQEFLSFLVDAIHEDLNRIIKKPYNENPDSDDSTVHDPQAIVDLGETYRANHRARNESIAMDLFNGFYKNTMECPDCGKISITFDPFSLVTVQLPIESTFTHSYTFVPLSGKPINHDIDFDKNGTVRALKEYIASKHPGVEAKRLWMAEVYSHKIYRVFDDTTTIAEANIQSSDHIFLFELLEVPSNPAVVSKAKKYASYSLYSSNTEDEVPEMDDPKADRFAVPVFMRQKNRNGNGWEYILHPTYVNITREEAQDYDCVLKKVLLAVSRFTTLPMLTDLENTNDLHEITDDKSDSEDASADDKEPSDRSTNEDGYVEVATQTVGVAEENTNGKLARRNGDPEQADRPVPRGFMESQYVLSSALRNQLFTMKYGKGKEGLHCTGLGSVEDRSITPMAERVKQPVRRGSSGSSTSGDESTTSTGSGADANGEHETQDSDTEIDDKPDIVVGEQPEDSIETPTLVDQGNESDELPDDPLMQKPGSKRGQKHSRGKNKGRRGKQRGYSKKDRPRGKFQQSNGTARSHFGGKSLYKQQEDPEDNPYYIKLGEGIVLDWYPEALTHIFGGDPNNEEDKRGHFTSHHEGSSKKIPVFQDEAMKSKRDKRSDRKRHGVSLDECFVETGKREVLSEDNAWYCGRCKELRRATKTLEIWTIPDILVVHLKRFGGNRSFRDKIDILVDYPVEGLDMTERVGHKEDGKEYIYDLFAVDNHFGGLGGGHYTAFAKNFYDGQWYDYNDASCTKLSDRSLHSNAAAYLLFYRRRSSTPLGPQYLQDLVNEARNPVATTDTEDAAAEESDSGEGRLGGRLNGSQRSSSGWIGAGALGQAVGAGNGGTGAAKRGVGSSLMTKEMGTSEERQGSIGPMRPDVGWSFATIDRQGDDAAGQGGSGSDAGSTAANADEDEDGDAHMVDSIPDLEANSFTAGAGTPEEDGMDYQDDHGLYSGGRDEVLHVEDSGPIDADDESTTTHEIGSPLGSGIGSESTDKAKQS